LGLFGALTLELDALGGFLGFSFGLRLGFRLGALAGLALGLLLPQRLKLGVIALALLGGLMHAVEFFPCMGNRDVGALLELLPIASGKIGNVGHLRSDFRRRRQGVRMRQDRHQRGLVLADALFFGRLPIGQRLANLVLESVQAIAERLALLID